MIESIAGMIRPFLWAHRGASAQAPENTLAAFSAALESGADGLELDIHLTRDGVPVVIHDETLDRTTDGLGPVARASSRQLQKLDAGSWFSADFFDEPVPFLEDVLNTFGKQLRLNLELKDFRAGMAVLEMLGHYPAADIVVSSFDYKLLQSLRCMDKSLSLAVLFGVGNWRHALHVARELSACSFNPAVNRINRPMIAACVPSAPVESSDRSRTVPRGVRPG